MSKKQLGKLVQTKKLRYRNAHYMSPMMYCCDLLGSKSNKAVSGVYRERTTQRLIFVDHEDVNRDCMTCAKWQSLQDWFGPTFVNTISLKEAMSVSPCLVPFPRKISKHSSENSLQNLSNSKKKKKNIYSIKLKICIIWYRRWKNFWLFILT